MPAAHPGSGLADEAQAWKSDARSAVRCAAHHNIFDPETLCDVRCAQSPLPRTEAEGRRAGSVNPGQPVNRPPVAAAQRAASELEGYRDSP